MLANILQPTHLIVVLIVALLILGPKRLPEAGRALGQGIKEFKGSITPSHDGSQDEISAPRSTPDEVCRGETNTGDGGGPTAGPSHPRTFEVTVGDAVRTTRNSNRQLPSGDAR